MLVALQMGTVDQRNRLAAGVTEKLAEHGIVDLTTEKITITGSTCNFVVEVDGKRWLARLGARTFDSDLKHAMRRFGEWRST